MYNSSASFRLCEVQELSVRLVYFALGTYAVWSINRWFSRSGALCGCQIGWTGVVLLRYIPTYIPRWVVLRDLRTLGCELQLQGRADTRELHATAYGRKASHLSGWYICQATAVQISMRALPRS